MRTFSHVVFTLQKPMAVIFRKNTADRILVLKQYTPLLSRRNRVWKAISMIIYQKLPGLSGRNLNCTLSVYDLTKSDLVEPLGESYEGQSDIRSYSNGKVLPAALRNKNKRDSMPKQWTFLTFPRPPPPPPLLTFHM